MTIAPDTGEWSGKALPSLTMSTMNVADCAMQLPAGTCLGVYEVRRLLGQGGFGVTYLGFDTSLEMPVAIKEYLPEHIAVRAADMTVRPLADKHRDAFRWGLSRFAREARTLAKFKHPNIVRVLSVFEANNTAYMVMEYEQGHDLKHLFEFPEWRSEVALRGIIGPIINGLAEVHRLGYIHRDIKPANILVRDNGTPVLLDFGSARMATGVHTRALTALITVGYAPLEQYNDAGDAHQGPWSDIYALGAVLYYAITGEAPVDSTLRGSALLNDKPDPITPLASLDTPYYSPAFCEAIDWALSFKVAERPQTLAEWAERLLSEGKTEAVGMPAPPSRSRQPTTTRPAAHDPSLSAIPGRMTRITAEHPGSEATRAANTLELSLSTASSPAPVETSKTDTVTETGPAIAFVKSLRRRPSLARLSGFTSLMLLPVAVALWQQGVFERVAASFSNVDDAVPVDVAGQENEPTPPQSAAANPVTEPSGDTSTPEAMVAREQRRSDEESRRRRLAELEQRLAAAEEENRRLEELRQQRLEASRLAAQELERLEQQAAAARLENEARAEQERLAEAQRVAEEKALARRRANEKARKAHAEQARLEAEAEALRQATTQAPIDSSLPITNNDMAAVFKRFSGLEQAIIDKDMAAVRELTVESPRNNAYFAYLFGNYESIEASIDSSMRASRRDQSISTTLTIKRMLRSNGDIALPSDEFARIPLKSVRRGEWSRIHW
ncbi:MAG: hypothetical protein CSB44_08670 [Gammaproteobacteria bacterium]|nr:MAG: hypothetical protein CSB44_08670 [Gammaproteobacteria bacterium]